MSENDEYSLHCEFSDRITKADKNSVGALIEEYTPTSEPFQSEGYNECCHWCNFRKG